MPHRDDIARQHPIMFILLVMLLGPFILGACLLFVIFYVVAVALDTMCGRS